MVAQARTLADWDGQTLAAAVACPALCVAGAEDALTGVEEVRTTAELIPGGRFLLIEDAGHSLLLESAAVYDAVESFLCEISDAGS